MIRPTRLQPSQALRGARTERAVLVFVLLALAALVAVPILVNQRVRDLRQSIAGSEPARTELMRLQFTFAREMSALTELMLTGDSAAAGDYRAALLREDSLFDALERRVLRLGPDVVQRFHEARAQAQEWHDRASNPEDLLEEYGDLAQPRGRRERQLFEALLETTRLLDRAILDHADVARSRIAAAERIRLILGIGLGFLALIVGAAAALLAGRSRRFATEAERRREQAEIALEKLAREAELRARLLQGITHDVKNPLGAAKGFAELLALGVKVPILPEQVPLVEGVQRSVDGALGIIADLLDVARADSGRLPVVRVPIDLASVMAESLEDYRAQAEAAGHAIGLERSDEGLNLHSDPGRVRQILQNLLSNAIKYTPAPGTITVGARIRTEVEGARTRRWVAVQVRDTGPGIAPEMRERIFDEFTRLEEGGAVEGHGLGLAIARRIARLLGGDLRVEDSEGPGTVFVLHLPLREPRELTPRTSEGETG